MPPAAGDLAVPTADRSAIARLWVIALVLAAFAGRAMFIAVPVNSDTAMFVYAGKLVAGGGRPGVDLLDNKLPSVGLLMSVPFRLFGAHWTAYATLGLGLSAIAYTFLWRVARDLWGRDAATFVAVAAAVWLNLPQAVYGQLQLETIQISLSSIAAACVLRAARHGDWRDAAVAGLCGGLAMWAKPTGGAVLPATCVLLAIAPLRPWLRIGLLFAVIGGAAVPLAVCVICVIACGFAAALPETLRQLHAYSAESSFDWLDVAKPLTVLVVLGFPLLILGVVCRRQRRPATARGVEVIFVCLWLLAELAGVVVQRRMYAYHFLVLGPPAALAVGLLARRARAVPITLAFGPAIAVTMFTVVQSDFWRSTASRDDKMIAYLAAHAGGQPVWCDDYPRLMVETDCRPASSVPLLFLMANGDSAPDFFGHRLLSDLTSNRPAYIAFAADPQRIAELYRHHMADVAASPARADAIARQLSAIAVFLQAKYRPETDISGVRLWRRNDHTRHDSAAVATADGR